jgi:hypothetical protein
VARFHGRGLSDVRRRQSAPGVPRNGPCTRRKETSERWRRRPVLTHCDVRHCGQTLPRFLTGTRQFSQGVAVF